MGTHGGWRHLRDTMDVAALHGSESFSKDYGSNHLFRCHVDASGSRTIPSLHSYRANQLHDNRLIPVCEDTRLHFE